MIVYQVANKHGHAMVMRGATSLLVVAFSMILLLTVTVGFMRLVIQDQQRANDDELSRGAYDSALAGIEDGKRVLQACSQGSADACAAINTGQCNTVHASRILSADDNSSNNDEVKLEDNSGTENGYAQAYTCVIITPNTADYRGSLKDDTTTVIPLAAENEGDISSITLSWYIKSTVSPDIALSSGTNTSLPPYDKWSDSGKITPPLIRAQLIQFANNSTVADLDGATNNNTLYLYPTSTGLSSFAFSLDSRETGTKSLQPATCHPDAVMYACSVTLTLPSMANRQMAYVRLTSFYGDADFRIALNDSSNSVIDFHGVEPSIDSTGRASDAYRRINARVQQVSTLAYPRATVDITGSFCKDFGVADSVGSYLPGSCTP